MDGLKRSTLGPKSGLEAAATLPVGHAATARSRQNSITAPGPLNFLENRRGAGNLARSRLSGGFWVMSEPSCSAEGRLKAGCSQDWLPHKAAHISLWPGRAGKCVQ